MTAHEFNLVKKPLFARRMRQFISEAVEALYSEQFDAMDALGEWAAGRQSSPITVLPLST